VLGEHTEPNPEDWSKFGLGETQVKHRSDAGTTWSTLSSLVSSVGTDANAQIRYGTPAKKRTID